MKKVVKIVIGLIIILFMFITYMVYDDNKYNNKIIKNIVKNTEIKDIIYFNEYNNYYIVKDKDYIYLFDKKYKEIFKVDNVLVYENKKNYDIIYKDELLMYMNDYYKNNRLVYEYYNIYTYELIDKVIVGG